MTGKASGGSEGRDDGPQPVRGPVPVRDLMKPAAPDVEGEGEPRWESGAREFEVQDESWTVRTAGAGTYGTGVHGTARLLAVHFFRADAPETPVREALVPAGLFKGMRDAELRALFEGATPIEAAH